MNISIMNLDFELNGIPITGWSEDADCLQFPGEATYANYRKGADGLVAFFASSERRGGLIVVKLLPTSPAIKPLFQQAEIWRQGRTVVWEGTGVDRDSNAEAQLLRGQLTKTRKFWTYGDDEVANWQFEFMFTDIIGNLDKVAF